MPQARSQAQSIFAQIVEYHLGREVDLDELTNEEMTEEQANSICQDIKDALFDSDDEDLDWEDSGLFEGSSLTEVCEWVLDHWDGSTFYNVDDEMTWSP